MLKITNLTAGYSLEPVLHSINIEVKKGQIVTLLGANGAGKSTLLKTISGLVKASEGKIEFAGRDITSMRPDKIVELGLAHVPEGRLVFPGLTVEENLKIGTYSRKYSTNKIKENMDKVYELFPRLLERRTQMAGTLSGGEQQMLAISRAMMMDPELLMLDEPSLGLAPVIVDVIMDTIQRINELGTTVLLIEQNAELALSISHYAYVLSVGKVVMEGLSEDVAKDKSIFDAYLGS